MERAAREMLVEEVRRFGQLDLRVAALGVQDPVLHVAVGRDDDQQHAPLGSLRNSRWRNDAPRSFGIATTPAKCVSCDSNGRGRGHELGGPLGGQLLLEPMDLDLLERLDDDQTVDEKPVALGRGHTTGRRVRARDEAHLLEIRHDVANRRGRKLEARVLRQRTRAHRLAVGDVALDERLQQMLGAGIQHERRF